MSEQEHSDAKDQRIRELEAENQKLRIKVREQRRQLDGKEKAYFAYRSQELGRTLKLSQAQANLARAVEALETIVPIAEAEIGHHAPIGLGEEVCKAWQERWKKLVDARTVLQALKGSS